MDVNPYLIKSINDPFYFREVAKEYPDATFCLDLHWIEIEPDRKFKCVEEPDYFVMKTGYSDEWSFTITGASEMGHTSFAQTGQHAAMRAACLHWGGRKAEIKRMGLHEKQ